ncbi:MAG: DUF4178 domain-containing protein [Myxococcota bacterium]
MLDVTVAAALSPLVWVILIVVAVVGVYGWRRVSAQRKARTVEEQKRQALVEDQRRILDLQPKDAVEHMGDTYLVDAVLLYDEEGTVWKTYLLGGAADGKDRWLSVEDDDRLEVSLYEVLPAGVVEVPEETPRALTVGEVTFRLEETGAARVRKRDAMGTREQGQCRYADYTGPERALLAVEWWGETPEVALGRRIHKDDLMILPGS